MIANGRPHFSIVKTELVLDKKCANGRMKQWLHLQLLFGDLNSLLVNESVHLFRRQLPSDIVVPQSINKSTPVVLDAPRSSIAKAFETLADRYVPAPQGKKGRR